jgi:hypothetical protein
VHIVLRRVESDGEMADPTVHIYSGTTVMRDAPDIPRFQRARENMTPAKVAHVEKKHEYPRLEDVPVELRKSSMVDDFLATQERARESEGRSVSILLVVVCLTPWCSGSGVGVRVGS